MSDEEKYQRLVDDATELARARKAELPAIYHWKLDHMADTFAKRLADLLDHGYPIDGMIALKTAMETGVGRNNIERFLPVCSILDKMKRVGGAGDIISADDPHAIEQLEARLERFEARGAAMRRVNSFYHMHGTLEGCPDITEQEARALTAAMASGENREGRPYTALAINESNNDIRRTRVRMADLLRAKAV